MQARPACEAAHALAFHALFARDGGFWSRVR